MREGAATAPTALVTGASALVSGATGFLGARLARLLLEEGYRVRILVHRRRPDDRLSALGAQAVEGDLGDPASLARAAEGQHLVFHTAGKVTDWGRREEFFRVNRDGTRNLLAACADAGVARLVHVSSLTVLGLPRTGELVDEDTPPPRSLLAGGDPYSASKLAAEELARQAHRPGGLATTVVRCGVIWGAGDPTFLPRIAALLRRRAMPLIDGGRNLIALSHVENLSRALLLAARTPAAAGRLYHVTDGEEITAREAFTALAAAVGAPPPRLSLPYPLVFGAAALVEGAARLARRRTPPPFTRYAVRLAACHARYDIRRAVGELGYRPAVTFRAGVAELARAGEGGA